RNARPVTAGIHDSLTPAPMNAEPADFTAPLATTYAQLRPAPRISDVRRPSRKLNTTPQTMPSGRPLRTSATTLPDGGSTANSTSASSPQAIRNTSAQARRPGFISELNLMPRHLASA